MHSRRTESGDGHGARSFLLRDIVLDDQEDHLRGGERTEGLQTAAVFAQGSLRRLIGRCFPGTPIPDLDNLAGQIVAVLLRVMDRGVNIQKVPLLVPVEEECRDVGVVGRVVLDV